MKRNRRPTAADLAAENEALKAAAAKENSQLLMDFFESITSIAYGKQMFFINPDGTWYNRATGQNTTMEDALRCAETYIGDMLNFD